MLSGYEAPFPVWPRTTDAKVEPVGGVSVEELVREWELELETDRRRAVLRLVPGGLPSGHRPASAA